jgi:hypothetical protein
MPARPDRRARLRLWLRLWLRACGSQRRSVRHQGATSGWWCRWASLQTRCSPSSRLLRPSRTACWCCAAGRQRSVGGPATHLRATCSSRAVASLHKLTPRLLFTTRTLACPHQVERLLSSTPVDRLPGVGPRLAESLRAAGYATARDLSRASPSHLCDAVPAGGLKPELAARLVEMGGGRDATPVVDKGPAKSIQVQMTLTPTPVPARLAVATSARRR